jgi:flagellar protein FlgJ
MNPTRGTMEARSALDAQALDRLKAQARERPDEAVKAAAKQFEAVFMNMLLKSMREALPRTDALASNSSSLYTSLLDQELATRMGDRGVGIADALVKQLSQGQRGRALPGSSADQTLRKLDSATGQVQGAGGAPKAFVDRMLPQAKQAERATGVPAAFMLGQAALESGWGQREIRRADGASSFNLFGIKATPNWRGATADVMTTEYVNGVARKQVEKFRAYGSYAEAFEDYARLIAGNPRYAQALQSGGDAQKFAWGLQQGGYATDPRYAEKLTRVIHHTMALTRTNTRSV